MPTVDTITADSNVRVEREDITGGSKYNTTYEGYNWGAGAKYKLK